jgi:hypothetical protein
MWPIPSETPQVHSDNLVGSLQLFVVLRVKSRRHGELDTGQREQLPP